MKVAHIFEGLHVGGAERSIRRLVEHLDKKEFEPILVASVPGEFAAIMADAGHKVEILNLETGRLMNRLLSSRSRNPIGFLRLYRQLKTDAQKLRAFVDAQGVDIVHTHHHHHHLVSAMACRRQIPSIWHMRAIIDRNALYGLQWRVFNFYGARYASCVIANSNAVKDHMSETVQKKTTVIHNGLEIERFGRVDAARAKHILGFSPQTRLVGAVGRFVPIKGFHNFISMAEMVAAQHKDVHFVLVGPADIPEEAEYRSACLRQIERAGLSERFTIVGELPDPSEFMPAFDILVLPTVTWEGLPNVVLEAQASGRPVVATDCGGSLDIIVEGETGYIVPRGDTEAMAAKVAELLADAALAERMGAAGKVRMNGPEFRIETTISRVENLYRSLVKREAKDRLPRKC